MRKSVAVSAFVLAIALIVGWFWATLSAENKPAGVADKPATEKPQISAAAPAPRIAVPSVQHPIIDKLVPTGQPSIGPRLVHQPTRTSHESAKGSSPPALSSPSIGAHRPTPPSPATASAPGQAGGVVQGLGQDYGKAISDAVAAGYLKEEEVQGLNREFATLVAVRKARLEVMRAIHLLEGVSEDSNTKQGQEAKRLLESLRASLQNNQNAYSASPATPFSRYAPSPGR